MKQFLLASSLIFLSCNNTINSQQHKNDWQEEKLKGRVKSIRHIEYGASMKNGNITKDNIIFDEYSLNEYNQETNYLIMFNHDGNITKKNHYKPNGNIRSQFSYKYDNRRNKIEEHFREDDYFRINYYSFNSKNQLIRFKSEQTLHSISYDDKHKTSIEKNKDGDYKFLTQYDDDGKIIETKEIQDYNTIISITRYKYDNRGNNIEKHIMGDPHVISYKDIYEYDNNDNPIKEKRITVDIEGITNISYEVNYIYKYDKYNNWIQRISYSDDCPYPCTLTERSIEYY